MENKKTKLTLSGIAKKSIENIELAKTQSKNSVVIEKKTKCYHRICISQARKYLVLGWLVGWPISSLRTDN